jgi:type I restriction enzyme S subunit
VIQDLRPYPTYKDSDLPWVGQIPEHWEIHRWKSLFAECALPVAESDEIVTCFRDGQVTLRKNRRTSGFMIALKEAGYQGVRKGQLVIHAMDAFAGAIGVSDSDGKCTPEYIVCRPRSGHTSPGYFAALLRKAAQTGFIQITCAAVRERAPRLRYPNFGDMRFPVPPAEEQEAILRFLGYADRRIRRYIRAKQDLLKLLVERRQAITESALHLASCRSLRIESAVDRIERPIDRQEEQIYTPIGLYNRGRGVFHKTPTKGIDLGDSTFFWIEEGDLVLSGQFAWEGAIALACKEENGCIASHRYPIFRGKPEVLDSAYLLSFFQTGWGQLLLDHHSRGAAGRNRPLNTYSLMKEKISIPPLPTQERIASFIRLESHLRQLIARQICFLQELRTRLVADVVTGKLDVREAAVQIPVEELTTVSTDDTDAILEDEETTEDSDAEEVEA